MKRKYKLQFMRVYQYSKAYSQMFKALNEIGVRPVTVTYNALYDKAEVEFDIPEGVRPKVAAEFIQAAFDRYIVEADEES